MTSTERDRHSLLLGLLDTCGYRNDLISSDYRIWIAPAEFVTADLVAFARPDQHDMATSAILAQLANSEKEVYEKWLPAAAALAAPAIVAALPDQLVLWKVSQPIGTSERLASVNLHESDSLSNTLRHLSPDAIRSWKQWGSQLPLFPVQPQLLDFGRRNARQPLTRVVEMALAFVRSSYPGGRPAMAPKLVIGAIAALMIRDKTGLGTELGAPALLDTAQQQYSGYFAWMQELDPGEQTALDAVVEFIGSQVDFASLEPSMVSDVYEQTMLDAAKRREQGSYYTPPALARRLVDAVPLEALPPQQRYIVDPACGSGTLLLASASRLEGLQPLTAGPRENHDYVVNHLVGYDRDPFAIEIAKLSLLMTSLPVGNSWQVEVQDSLSLSLTGRDQPSVIVSNPPWHYSRKDGQRHELANDFLTWMVRTVRPGGFIACILPVSWLNSATSRRAREEVLADCDLLDVWQLPDETFARQGMSSAAPAVVVAQRRFNNKPRPARSTLVKRVAPGRGNLDRFLEKSIPTSALLIDPGQSGESLLLGPLTEYYASRDGFTPLEAVAVVRSGSPHKPKREPRGEMEATHLEISSAADLRPFGQVDRSVLHPVNYPDDFHHVSRSDDLIRARKVLASAKRSPESVYRVKAGLDLIGVVPRETLYMIVPSDGAHWHGLDEFDRLCATLAILGSGLANVWVVEREPKRNISAKTYRELPVPTAESSLRQLASVGRDLLRSTSTNDRAALEQTVLELESVIAEVYEMDSRVREIIAKTLADTPGPEQVIRYVVGDDEPKPADYGLTAPPSYGTVLENRVEELKVWVSGVTDEDGAWIPLPLKAPGWVAEAGRDFVVSGDLNDLEKADYSIHRSEWVSSDRPSPDDIRSEAS